VSIEGVRRVSGRRFERSIVVQRRVQDTAQTRGDGSECRCKSLERIGKTSSASFRSIDGGIADEGVSQYGA
jgi:hypothetical protein